MKVLSDILHKAGILKEAAEAYSSGGYSVLVRNSTTQRLETLASSAFTNIYTADGTLTSNRTVTMGAFTLSFEKDIRVNGITVGRGGSGLVSNTVLGSSALGVNASGGFNVAIGVNSLFSHNSGNSNVAVGHSSLYSNLIGGFNTAIGTSALNNNISAGNNTAVGSSSLYSTTGASNTAVGSNALLSNSSGSNNTAIGANAGYGVGTNANITGSNNIFIGRQSVGVSTSESNRTWIGNSSTTSTWLGGNLLLGTTTDAGYKLDVTGVTRSTTRVMAGTFTPGAGITADDKIVSDGFVRAAGINMRPVNVGDNIFIGLQSGSGDIQLWANNANVGQINAIGSGAGSILRIGGYGYNPGAGASGFRNSILIDNAISPTGNNTADYVMVHLNPQIGESDISGSYTSSSIRGFYYNPAISVINTTTHYAFESTAGKIKVSDLSGTGSRMVVADSTGVLTTQSIPSAGISGSGVTGQVAYWNGTNSQTGSNNLFWDAANSILGIGTNAPAAAYKLDVVGAIRASTYLLTPAIYSSGSLNFGVAGGTVGMTMVSATRNIKMWSGGSEPADAGQRLQVYGDAYIKGSGATSATSGLVVQDSAGTAMLTVRNDGIIRVQKSYLNLSSDLNNGIGASNNGGDFSSSGLGILYATAARSSSGVNHGFYGGTITHISGEFSHLRTTGRPNFAPTSGTGTFSIAYLESTINQTGGANGIARGLYVNPTLTAAADWRSIEWSNNSGWGLYGAGTSNNYLAGDTYIGTTTTSATKLTIGGTETASSAIARGGLLNTTLVASANNDVLVGLDVNPTFTNGAFTGVRNAWIRVGNYSATSTSIPTNIDLGATFSNVAGQNLKLKLFNSNSGNNADVYGFGVSTGQLDYHSGGGSHAFWSGNTPTKYMQLFGTGNVAIQNGGTFADAGYRLDVNGTARVSGSSSALLELNSTSFRNYRLVTDSTGFGIYDIVDSAYRLSINAVGFLGIRNSNPSASLDIPASTTVGASMRIRSGAAPSTLNDGDIWFDGTDLKMRIGGVTKTFTLV